MRGSLGLRLVDEGDDTLTESCEGAVNFMVIEMRERSLHQVHLWEMFVRVFDLRAAQAEGWVPPEMGFFCFYWR
jgi:hypothetical protein